MQRIIQINIAGRVLPIEEDAYLHLKEYIDTLERQFKGDDGSEILGDIENRIAELFFIRLQGGSPAIDRADVQKVIETLGAASELHDNAGNTWQYSSQGSSYSYNAKGSNQSQYKSSQSRLLRNPFDKVVAGVCSGIAIYFDIDPIIVRLLVALMMFTGIGLLVYIVAWISIPPARSLQDLDDMASGKPYGYGDVNYNMKDEMYDMKRRAEQMSRDLKDFFAKKK